MAWPKEIHTVHGAGRRGKRTPEYGVWMQMRRRCNSQTAERYHDYGGRGIKVCERWGTYAAFIADMGPRPASGYSIDRIDNDGNYEPSNCRWATQKQQTANRRKKAACRMGHPYIEGALNHNGSRKCLECRRLWLEQRKQANVR